ncbi:MAG: Hint domain-containing protein [Omnitrophica WOR_2 bacterium]
MISRPLYLTVMVGILLLAACAPTPSGNPTTSGSISAGTAIVSTGIAGTAVPIFITTLPPNYTPPPSPVPPTLTPIPTLAGGLSPTELKYRVLEQFPNFFFCDPDYYPIARADELDLARQRFPEIQANPEEFNAILAHNHLTGISTFNDDQILLIYREHKKLAALHFELSGGSYQFQLQAAKTEGSGELVTGTIDSQGSITVLKREPSIATCPICLAYGTLIDTPAGPVPIQDLRAGTPVWTLDRSGARVAAPVIQVGKTIVPDAHQVVHLVLDDGREVWVSAGHPSAGGLKVGQLQVGDSLDGGTVLSANLMKYTGYATYDLLPAGETGFYWANGIMLASTLANK